VLAPFFVVNRRRVVSPFVTFRLASVPLFRRARATVGIFIAAQELLSVRAIGLFHRVRELVLIQEAEPWQQSTKSDEDSRRCHRKNSVRLQEKAGAPRTKKVPPTNGTPTRRDSPGAKEVRSVAEVEDVSSCRLRPMAQAPILRNEALSDKRPPIGC
jgi:hypothetical protein